MGQEVGKVKPSSNFKELLARVDSIRNNSSDCGEYTDEQTEELANLCTQLVDSFNHIVISLENECDRLRDGETSMVEGDYIYYRDGTVLSRPHMKVERGRVGGCMPRVMWESSEEAAARRDQQKQAVLLWTQAAALDFVASLIDVMRTAGFGVALGGSLLRGDDKRDLDLVLFPLDATNFDLERARQVLRNKGMNPLWYRHEIARFWTLDGSIDDKHVEVWGWENHRVDVFFLK